VKKTWQLVELRGCWWACEGELPPPEAFTTHAHAHHILGPSPLAQWRRNSFRDSCLVAKPAPRPPLMLHSGAQVRTGSAEKTARDIRRATRRHHSA
jgi:hypothetical protein